MSETPSPQLVYSTLQNQGGLTTGELASYLNSPKRDVWPSLNDLLEAELVEKDEAGDPTRFQAVGAAWVLPGTVDQILKSIVQFEDGDTKTESVHLYDHEMLGYVVFSNTVAETLTTLSESRVQNIHAALQALTTGGRSPEHTAGPYEFVSTDNSTAVIRREADQVKVYAIVRAVVDNTTDENSLKSFEQDALLTEYSELREEVRSIQELQHRRVTGGLTAMAAILGYSLLAESGLEMISLIPVIIALMFVLTIQTTYGILYLGRHAYDIEQRIGVETVGWESSLGAVIRNNDRHSLWEDAMIDWSLIPNLMIYSIIGLIYATMVFVSLYILAGSDLPSVFGIDPVLIAAVVYGVTTIIGVVSGVAYRATSKRLQPDETPDKEVDHNQNYNYR